MMQDFNSLLQVVVRNLGLDKKAREFGVLSVWKVVVPEAYRESTKADSIYYKGKKAYLRIKVKHPTVASELGFELESLLEKMNGYSAQTGIHLEGIELRVGR
jgi:hypothetical protein